jgi:hypothetical protein
VQRKSWRWLVAVGGLSGVLAVGCGGEAPEPETVVDEGPTQPADSATHEERRRTIRGLCVMGHEVRTFIPCGSRKVYWIHADQASLDAFQIAIERYTDEPFEPFSAEIDGRLTDEKGEGFAADYDGQFFVERLIHLAPASELDCDG